MMSSHLGCDDDVFPSGLDYEHYDSELSWPGNNLTDTVMRMWMKRHGKLVHSYAFVGYMLSPNPIIMRHNQDRGKTAEMQDVSSVCYFVFLNYFLTSIFYPYCD
jgi:hypothetical protein